MPISVTCSECNSTYRVADEVAGKAIKCKKCGARVAVPSADDDLAALKAGPPPAGDAEEDGADGEPKAKKKGGAGKIIAIVAGVLVAGCCVCTGIGGGISYYVFIKGRDAVDNLQKDMIAKMGKDKGVVAGGAAILDKRETLTNKDPRIENGKPAKVYKVRLEANKQYVIDMKADKQAFGHDPYLILLDPQNKQVARDDDGGGGLDAQIQYRPTTTGEYTVQATCLQAVSPEGLPFHLTVKLK